MNLFSRTDKAAGVLLLLLSSQSAFADFVTDINKVFDWGEQSFPQLLPSHEPTKNVGTWYFRYYAKTKLYVGADKATRGIYLLEDKPKARRVYIDSVANLLRKSAVPSVVCDTTLIPGLQYTQTGNHIKLTTAGQCIVSPKNDICAPRTSSATGISIVKRMDVKNYQLQGIHFFDPAMGNVLAPQIKNYASIKSCIRNAPAEFSQLTLDVDGCFDVSERVKDFPSIQGLLTVTPPVTIQLQGSLTSEVVADCFATDASLITDAVTHEVWDKKPEGFVKR